MSMLQRSVKLKCNIKSRHVITSSLVRYFTKTHYEVLGVEKDCTQKEIRDAYVKLCKELHPDVKGAVSSSKGHHKFAELNQAYTILSKPLDRKHYDDSLRVQPQNYPFQSTVRRSYTGYEDPHLHRPGTEEYHEDFPRYQDFADNFTKQRVHHKKSQVYVVAGCLVLIVAGASLHYAAFKYGSSSDMKSRAKEQSKINWAQYHEAKNDYIKYGLEGQMERLLGYKHKPTEDKDGGGNERSEH